MKIRIEKKQGDKYLVFFGQESYVDGIYLTKEDLLKLKANLDEMLEYNLDSNGDAV